ncbi:hypothetical protein [Georgenia deserti]|uniref:DUF2269 domain-containing protein n=1 Tax=Georgenia deserti TaxID=2093781 RepID=A0ABW4L9E4_9MICO
MQTTRHQLGRRARRTVLVTHIAAAGTWLGMDVVMGVLVLVAGTSASPTTQAVAYRALEMVVTVPLVVAAVLTAATGMVLGLGSRYGLVRYWWVTVKVIITAVLITLVLVLLRPGVREAAERGEAVLGGGDAVLAVGDLIFPPIVSTAAVLFAIVLSVVKPWGRTRPTPAVAGTWSETASDGADRTPHPADDVAAVAEQPGRTRRTPVRRRPSRSPR